MPANPYQGWSGWGPDQQDPYANPGNYDIGNGATLHVPTPDERAQMEAIWQQRDPGAYMDESRKRNFYRAAIISVLGGAAAAAGAGASAAGAAGTTGAGVGAGVGAGAAGSLAPGAGVLAAPATAGSALAAGAPVGPTLFAGTGLSGTAPIAGAALPAGGGVLAPAGAAPASQGGMSVFDKIKQFSNIPSGGGGGGSQQPQSRRFVSPAPTTTLAPRQQGPIMPSSSTNYAQLAADAQRRRAFADALLAQSMQTRGPSLEGQRIVPKMSGVEGLAQLGEALLARRAGKQATSLTAQAEEQKRQAQAAALRGFNTPPNMVQTPEAQNPFALAQSALEAGVDPKIAEAYLKNKLPGNQASPFGVVDTSNFTPDSLATFAKTHNYRDLVPVDKNMFGQFQPRDYTPESLKLFEQTKDPGDLRRIANYSPQQLPGGGIGGFNPVSGQIDTTPVANAEAQAQAAELARRKAEATATGEASGKAQGAILSRALNAGGIEDVLDIAEPLIDEATGSGTGAIRDKLAAFFGVSTTGAQATAQLLPLQAAIMLRQPRMEGPQSDRDVQLYRDAAGQIGDPSVPGPTKKAALKTIRQLNDKYAGKSAGEPPRIASDADYEKLASGTKFLDPDGKVRVKP